MSKTDKMKVIDLLNKIANGENLPKKILYFDKVFYLIKTEDDFYTYSMRKDEKDWESWINNKTNLICNINETVLILDDEFELIEDQTIDIDSIEEFSKADDIDWCYPSNENIQKLGLKMNEIIRAVKHLNKEI